ncbi:hypothetical protein FB451DRAFT_1514119 [Mycena latifolia]|nr:hypothetical protein FB451DRAFT_1514119 [Mycena latifolia]
MAPITSLLLQNGTLLIHDNDDRVQPLKADLLVINNKITEIGVGISAPSPDTTVIDCTGKIVPPGFIDTHHHLWQTQLKGRHANDLLLDSIPKGWTGNLTASLYTPKDIFWGELGGCMEAVDAGTTMVVDHAHMNYSAEHSSSAISATAASGIRSYFCYCPTGRVASWSPFELAGSFMPDWVQSQLVDLAAKQPFADGRVRLGFAFDGFFLPKDMVVGLYEQVRGLGIKLITSHYMRNAISGTHSLVGLLSSYGLLKDDVLFSHANGAIPEDAVQLAAANAHVSATPDTELQMRSGLPSVASLGVDCHSNNSGDILTQMRLALQSTMANTVEEAYNLGTIMGARAVGMGSEIGSIAVGKLADLVIFDGESPSMVCAAEHDPVAAIVLHASVRDIDTVIVDGQIRKAGGKLVPVEVVEEEKSMEWKESRERLEAEIGKLDTEAAQKAMTMAFHVDPTNIVDHL